MSATAATTLPPTRAVPAGACDCHMHVFDPALALAPTASAKPPPRSQLQDYRQVQAALGLSRAVVVQSMAYGLDNQCLLPALNMLGDAARGVAMVDTTVTDATLEHMHAAAVDAPEFRALRTLLDNGNCWIKLSAPYETSRTGAPDYLDVSLLASVLARAYPQRCVWASNWPHIGRQHPPQEADLLALLRSWAPDDATFRHILIDNPQQLYGFTSMDAPSSTP